MAQQIQIELIRQNRKKMRQTLINLSDPKLFKSISPKKKVYAQKCYQESVQLFYFQQNYTIQKKIGEGAHGVVYKCKSKSNNKSYAIKECRAEQQILSAERKSFEVLLSLNHPSIIKGHQMIQQSHRERLYTVMEFFPYNSLICYKTQMNDISKKQVIKKVAQALAYIHQKGVCHRDIKLQNVLFNPNSNKIKIIDFGIAKKIKTSDQKHLMLTNTGTLHYLAPQIISSKLYDEKVDIWSLGVMAYYLFFDEFPFSSTYAADIKHEILNKSLQFNSDDRLLCNLLPKMLEKDPNKRLSAWQILKHPWLAKDSSENNLIVKSQSDLKRQTINLALINHKTSAQFGKQYNSKQL